VFLSFGDPMKAIRTAFPGGNGIQFEWQASDCLSFTADPRGAEYALWFHFVVPTPLDGSLRCELRNASECLGWPFTPELRPVFRAAGGQWQRAPHAEVDEESGLWAFVLPCSGGDTEVAFCYPYQELDWLAFWQGMPQAESAEVRDLGTSAQGRPFRVYSFGTGETPLLLMARVHAGETPGSFTLEGLCEALLPHTGQLRVEVVPFLDLDAVVEGEYGKAKLPLDFYQRWGSPLAAGTTVELVEAYLESLARPPVVALDCHAPTANEPHYLDCMVATGPDSDLGRSMERLVSALLAEAAGSPATTLDASRCIAHEEWFQPSFLQSPAGYLQSVWGTLALTLEASYCCSGGMLQDPTSWRALGRAVGRAVIQHLEIDCL
jgi:hypothetical protein